MNNFHETIKKIHAVKHPSDPSTLGKLEQLVALSIYLGCMRSKAIRDFRGSRGSLYQRNLTCSIYQRVRTQRSPSVSISRYQFLHTCRDREESGGRSLVRHACVSTHAYIHGEGSGGGSEMVSLRSLARDNVSLGYRRAPDGGIEF